MGNPDELRAERPELDGLGVGVGLAQLDGAEQTVLVELRLDQPQRQPRRPDLLDAALAEQVRERADVILVAVRQEDGANRLATLGEIREVGEDQVDPEVLVAREREPGVDDQRGPVGLEYGHVLADLTEAAERDDSGTSGHRGSLDAGAG